MALTITRAGDPITVEQIVLCLYAAPGLGKTSLAFTAEAPLLLDFDGGVHRACNRQDTVRVKSWTEVAHLSADDLAGYKTVIVDTAGRALDALTPVLVRDDPKNGTRSGALSLQGYGALKTAFTTWLTKLKSAGVDVVLIAHMDEQRKGDEIIERIDVQGGSKAEIYKSADAMGRIYVDNGKRVLNFSPTDVAHGKNPGNLKPLTIPALTDGKNPTVLADVIASIKATLNAETEAVRTQRERLEAARQTFSAFASVEQFNAAIETLKADSPVVKKLLVDVASEKGFSFDAKARAFVAPAAAVA